MQISGALAEVEANLVEALVVVEVLGVGVLEEAGFVACDLQASSRCCSFVRVRDAHAYVFDFSCTCPINFRSLRYTSYGSLQLPELIRTWTRGKSLLAVRMDEQVI